MLDEYVIIEIGGKRYYIEAERLRDLSFIGGRLVNTSNSSVRLISSYGDGIQYPYIDCSAMSACRYYYQNGYNYNYSIVTTGYKYNGYNIHVVRSTDILIYLLLIIVCARMLWKR